jgi:hypothetical protein
MNHRLRTIAASSLLLLPLLLLVPRLASAVVIRHDAFVIRFDAPPDGLPLEGAAVAMDSGSPFLIRSGEHWRLAGISAATEPPGAEDQLGRYGTRNFAARVDTKSDWLREVIDRGTDDSFPWEDSRPVEPDSHWARTPAERHLERWIKAINSGKESEIRKLVRDAYRLRGDDARAKTAELMGLSKEIAPLRIRAVRSAGPAHASLLVWVEEEQFWGSVTSSLDPRDLRRLQNVVLRNAPAPPQ